VQRGDVPQVEQLELGDDPQFLGAPVQLHHERPRVHEDLVAEVDRPAGQRARVRRGLQHPQPVLVGVGDRAPGRQLDDQPGVLAQGLDGVAQPGGVQGRPGLLVADVHVDHGGLGGLAVLGRADELLQRDGKLRHVGLGGLGAGRRHGDERRCSHSGILTRIPRTAQ
jgi:hypothetical protein